MNDTIYTLLNDMDHQPELCENYEATPADVKKWKKERMSRISKSKHRWQKYTAAAACACLLIAAVSPARQTVYAQMSAFVYSLSDLLGIKKDLTPYSIAVGESVSKKGITVTLNDVIMDDKTMLISCTTESPEPLKDPSIEAKYFCNISVSVNGSRASVGASGSSEVIDESHIVSCLELELPNVDPTKSMDVSLDFNVNDINVGSISFTAEGNELMVDTKTIMLNQSFTLPDETQITLVKYTTSDVNQKVYFTSTSDHLTYDIMLKGTDDLGNEVEFLIRFFGSGEGRMEVSTINNGYINENASKLTLTPYAVKMPEESGKMSNDFEAVGEEITIDLTI